MQAGRNPRATKRHGFSLVELIIVVVIVAIISAIAIPRLSRGSNGAKHSSLKQSLLVFSKAVDHYAAEHNGNYPSGSNVALQLTTYTDIDGNTSDAKTPPFIYGPYLRKIPAAPGGKYPGATGIATVDGPGVGWIYRPRPGRVYLNRHTAIDENEEDSALGTLLNRIGL